MNFFFFFFFFFCILCSFFFSFAASIFGHHLRLEPLHLDKKLMWKREMNCLLSICDYIVELIPVSQDLKDGTALEVKKIDSFFLPLHFFLIFFSRIYIYCFQVMSSRPRTDIGINLPALKKLDAMLLVKTESCRVDKNHFFIIIVHPFELSIHGAGYIGQL